MARTSNPSGEITRIAAFERESVALVADQLVAIPEGWVARTPSLPLVYSLNHVGVDVAIAPAGALELLERHMGDLPYRHLVVEHERSGERLAAELRPAGWKINRHVVMAFTGEPDRHLDTRGVVEVEEADAAELMAEWILDDDEVRHSPDAHGQLLEATQLTWRARNARRFGVIGRDRALAGITMLYSDGVIAQVEDVYVVPGERRRGLGRMLVTHAVVEALDARHELVFIPADDEDWPKELYAHLGFEPVARVWVFHAGMTA